MSRWLMGRGTLNIRMSDLCQLSALRAALQSRRPEPSLPSYGLRMPFEGTQAGFGPNRRTGFGAGKAGGFSELTGWGSRPRVWTPPPQIALWLPRRL